MKTLILDYSIWRCGGLSKYSLGEGTNTYLKNKQGFMCCLGQFSLQLDKTLKGEYISLIPTPDRIPVSQDRRIPLLTKQSCFYGFISTEFSEGAMGINDDERTTPAQKITKLRSLLKKYNYKLKVINKK